MLQLDDSVWASMVARARRHHDHEAARIVYGQPRDSLGLEAVSCCG